jgi:tetratricopeptide (TPR) repeat protein
MQQTLALITKKAIDAALHSDWRSAIELNLQILERDPENTDSKIRLGRAYIQIKEFNKAKKIFKEILKKDPINAIAKKNLELANNNKTDNKNATLINTKSLLMEPSKCSEQNLVIDTKGVTANEFHPGQELLIRVKKRELELIAVRKGEKTTISTITDTNIVQRANTCMEKGGNINATYLRGNGKDITVILKASLPVFKSDKQEVRPYLKKGSFDEPELEIEEMEEVSTE